MIALRQVRKGPARGSFPACPSQLPVTRGDARAAAAVPAAEGARDTRPGAAETPGSQQGDPVSAQPSGPANAQPGGPAA